MFDMFDSNRRGWLIKLIEAVEAVEEDAIDAIVEDEDGIAVEAICSVKAVCGSDTMKKQVRIAEMREREKKQGKEKENQRERIENIREEKNWIMIFLKWIEIQYISLIYKWIYTHKIGSRTF